MKRFLFVWVALALGSAPLARAQDAATQQRLDELSGRIENLIAAQDALTKQVNELRRELSSVHEMASKPAGNWASPEDLKRVAKGIEDVDRKRIADSELVQRQLEKIRQLLDRPIPPPKKTTSTPSKKPRPPTSRCQPEMASNMWSNRARLSQPFCKPAGTRTSRLPRSKLWTRTQA